MDEFGYHKPQNYRLQKSVNLKYINKKSNTESHYIPIDIFRSIYKEDPIRFSNLVKELLLRGGEFKLGKESYLFPKIIIDKNEYILVKTSTDYNAYKEIDFNLINIPNFIDIFNINENSFFNFIPLEGFKVFNLNEEQIYQIKLEFIKHGFLIEKLDEDEHSLNKTIKEDVYIYNNIISIAEIEELKREIEIFQLKNNLDFVENILDLYNKLDNGFYYFVRFNDLNISSDIKNIGRYETIKSLETEEGFNLLNSKDEVAPNLIKSLNLLMRDNEFLAKRLIQIIDKNKAIRKLSILENIDRNFIRWMIIILRKQNIMNFGDLNIENLKNLFNTKSIGKRKKLIFLNEISEFIINFIISHPNYEENKLNEENKFVEEMHFRYYFCPFTEKFQEPYISNNDLKEIEKETYCEQLNLLEKNYNKIFYLKNIDVNLSFFLIDTPFITNNQRSNEVYNSLMLKPISDLLNPISKNFMVIKELLIYIEQIISTFEKNNIADLEKYFDYGYNDNEKLIIKERILNPNPATLKELGDILNVTRERVRQLQQKIVDKVNASDLSRKFKIYSRYISARGDFLIKDEQMKSFIINFKIADYKYIKDIDILVLDNYYDEVMKLIDQFDEFINNNIIVDIKNLREFTKIIQSEIGLNSTQIYEVLINHVGKKYKVNENNIQLKNIMKKDAFYYIFSKYYHDTILDFSDENNLNNFVNLYNNYFPNDVLIIDNKKIYRQIQGIFTRLEEKIIKVSSWGYKIIDDGTIPYDLLDKIEKFIDEEIRKNGVVTNKKIYRNFKEQISSKNLDENSLYYVLKLMFNEEYKIEGKTKKMFYFKDSPSVTMAELIENAILKNGGTYNLEELAKELGVEVYTISNNDKKANLFINNGVVSIVSNDNIKENTLVFINKVVMDFKQKLDYVPIQYVYEELMFDNQIAEDLLNNNYNNIDKIKFLIKQLYPEINANSMVILNEGIYEDYFNIFIKEIGIKDRYLKNDFFEVGDKLGFSNASKTQYYYEFLRDEKIYPIDETYFMIPSAIKVDNKVLIEVNKFIEDNINEDNYLSLYRINNELYKISDINGLRPTPQLVSYIAVKYLNYRAIEYTIGGYDNDPYIITDNTELTLEDILFKQINNYNYYRTEYYILNYLKEAGLVREGAKSIYKSFFTKGLLKKDEHERIRLGNIYD